MFPNDDWLKWSGYTVDDSLKEKAANIEAYMSNKTRIGIFRTTISKLIYDYIDYGVAFAVADFRAKFKTMPNGKQVPDFIGPIGRRISPEDIVFNPLADDFEGTPKIVRSVKTIGELHKMAKNEPDNMYLKAALERRHNIKRVMGGYSVEDFNKAQAYEVDGFGDLYEYYQSNYVEILEFFGDYFDNETGELYEDQVITIMDRSCVIRQETLPQQYNGSPICYVGWRERPDNLWSMGPLENLIGLQYRLDHLENLKADAMDLLVHPPLKIIGEVEEFVWGPGAEIDIDSQGSDVQELGKNANGIFTASSEMKNIEDRMELYAGAPREAMGIRSPGEKTAFEVDSLQNAAGKIFQEKITHFEIELLEKLLNKMLETAQRNLDMADTIRVMDNDIGAEVFTSITAADITANGKIRPVGARHFSKQSQDLRNLSDMFNIKLGEIVQPHTSALEVTKFIDDTLGLSGYKIFQRDAATKDGERTAIQQGRSEAKVGNALAAQGITPTPEEEIPE